MQDSRIGSNSYLSNEREYAFFDGFVDVLGHSTHLSAFDVEDDVVP